MSRFETQPTRAWLVFPVRVVAHIVLASILLTLVIGFGLGGRADAASRTPGHGAPSKPTWRFTVTVAWDQQTLDANGGLPQFEQLVDNQLATVSSRFVGFAAKLVFSVPNTADFILYAGDPGVELSAAFRYGLHYC